MCGCSDLKYAKKNHTHSYVNQSGLTAALADYVTQTALTAALAGCIDQAALDAAIAGAGHIDQAALDAAIAGSGHIDQAALDAAIAGAGHIDQAALDAAIAGSGHIDQAALDAAIAGSGHIDQAALDAAIEDFIDDVYLFEVGRVTQIPTLLNGWEAFGGGYTNPRYYRYAGRVWLQGTLKNTTSTELTHAFTMPSDYHPTLSLTMRGDSGMGNDCRIHVYNNGQVWFQTTFRGYVCIDGLSFTASQI